MDFFRAMVARWHMLIHELTKFGVIGVINTVLDLGIWNALLFMGPLKAKVVAAVVATTSSYFMNRHWTFRHRARSGIRREYILFFTFNGIGLAITAGVLAIATYIFSIEDRLWLNIVNGFGMVLATAFRFWSYRRWVFLHPEDALYQPENQLYRPGNETELALVTAPQGDPSGRGDVAPTVVVRGTS